MGRVGKVATELLGHKSYVGPTTMTGQIIETAADISVLAVVRFGVRVILRFQGGMGHHRAVERVVGHLEPFCESLDHFRLGGLDAEGCPVDLET